jgi:HlyD family secretion protein
VKRLLSWIVFGVGAAVAVAGWLLWTKGRGDAPPTAPWSMPPLPATLAAVERGPLEAKVSLTGTVRSVHAARLGFAIGGTVASIPVREGQAVEKGDPLAALDDRDQAARLASAKADTALARAELAVLEAGSRPEEIRRLEEQARAAEAELRWTESEVARLKPLAESEVVSVSSYEEMVGKRDSARGRLGAAREALGLAKAGTREEDLVVARARVAAREAAEALAQREIDKTKVEAPYDGQVVRRLAAPGDAVNAGQPVLELVDLRRREVEVEIPARHAARLGARPRVDLAADERPDVRIEAVLDARVEAADERSRSIRGIVRLGDGVDDAGALRPGAFVRATLHLEPLPDRLLVPTDAVRLVPTGSVVVKAVPPVAAASPAAPGAHAMPPPWKAVWIPVRVLGAVAGKTAVEPLPPAPGAPADPDATLGPDDRVVVVGVDRMFPGAPVMPRAPAPAAGAQNGPTGKTAKAP